MLQKKAFKRLGMALALSSLVLPLCVAHAGTWPEKPIRLIIPAGQGGSADPLGRMVGEELSKAFNQSVVVENRPGVCNWHCPALPLLRPWSRTGV